MAIKIKRQTKDTILIAVQTFYFWVLCGDIIAFHFIGVQTLYFGETKFIFLLSCLNVCRGRFRAERPTFDKKILWKCIHFKTWWLYLCLFRKANGITDQWSNGPMRSSQQVVARRNTACVAVTVVAVGFLGIPPVR